MLAIDQQLINAMRGASTLTACLEGQYGHTATWDMVAKYSLGYGDKGDAILWQYAGYECVGGDFVIYNEEGKVEHCAPLFSECQQVMQNYYVSDEGLFGGQLVADAKNVVLVQDPLTCLSLAIENPSYTFVAVGHNRQLTTRKMSLLLGKHLLLMPTQAQAEKWRSIANTLQMTYRMKVI